MIIASVYFCKFWLELGAGMGTSLKPLHDLNCAPLLVSPTFPRIAIDLYTAL